MSERDFRRRADAVRAIPLETVLLARGATRDPRDRAKWHTERGPVSIREAKFTNWHTHNGGGGAIDLVMHLAGVDHARAVTWLEGNISGSSTTAIHRHPRPPHTSLTGGVPQDRLRLPHPDEPMLERARAYLTQRRHLSPEVLKPLIQCGRLYADNRANAVFVLVASKAQRPVGAELRGTGDTVWRGMAPGTCKDQGFFWVGDSTASEIVLCESAIDAISCWQLDSRRICISTSGVRSNPLWLRTLIRRGYRIHCGFDTDDAGESAATRMIAEHPTIHRLRPPAHDWNDALRFSR